MNIEFKKITSVSGAKRVKILRDSQNLDLLDESESVGLSGVLERVDSKLVRFSGRLSGELNLVCVRSGESFIKKIDESLVLYFSDGIWKMQDQKGFEMDIIEFFDGFIDMDFILRGEIESIRLDYNIKE